MKTIYVSRVQIMAAQALVSRNIKAGREVPSSLLKIANAKPPAKREPAPPRSAE